MDDDEDLLTVAKKFLTQYVSSFDVVTTKSPHDALHLLGEQPFDAVVADYQMPKMSGLELLETIREDSASIPFIMFTGRGHEEIAIQALNLGADYYLKKEGKAKSLYTQLAHILDSLIAHKRTEEALKRSEYEKTLILSNASDAIVYYNCNLEIIWANDVALAPIDASLKEIIGKPCHIVWRQRSTPCEDCPVVKALETGNPQQQEITTINGNIWKDRVFPVRDDSGSLLGAVEMSLDITELKGANAALRRHHKELEQLVEERTAELSRTNEELTEEIAQRIKTETKLQKSEERYRFLFESAPIGIGISNAEGRVIGANQQMQQITGYSIDELKTINLRETYVNPQEREQIRQAMQKTGQIRDWDVQLRRKDGSTYLAQLNMDIAELNGQLVFFTTARDNTKIRQAEKALQQSEQRFRQLVETMHDAFGIQDETGLITYVNDRTSEMIGYSQDEMLGHPAVDFLDETNRKIFEKQLIKRKKGSRSSYELTWTRKDGSRIPTIMSSTPIVDANGHYKGSFAVITDITNLKQAEDALRESEERYRTLSDAALEEGIAIHEKGMILEANKAFARIFGYELSELIAKDGFELFAPEFRGLARARILNESETPYEGLLVRKDGTSFPARIIGTNTKFKGKSAQIITIQDITYQAVVEDQAELVCRYLPGGILTFVNEAYCRYFDKTREELINHHFLPLIPEEDQETVERQISLLTLENPVTTYEHKVITATGDFAWQQWTDRAIFDDQGHIVEYQAVGRDITERKQIETALQESEERYRKLTELHFDGIAIHDNNVILDINAAGAQIVGLNREELIGEGLFDYLQPKSFETVQKSMSNKQETPFEIVVRKKDGQQIHLEIMPGNCMYQGQSARMAAFRDITERRQAEQQLKDSEDRLRILFEEAPDGYYLHDLEGNLLDGNRTAEDITGYKREELIGKNILDLQLMPEEQIPKAAEGLMSNMEGKPSGPEQFTILRKDGTRCEVEIRTYPVTIKDQMLVLGIARDITERLQAETALRESEVKYKYLVDELQEELIIYQDNCVVFANKAVAENTGYSLEELYALSPEETQAIIHPEDQALLAKRIGDRLNGIQTPSPLEYRRLRKDGAVRWIEADASLITYNGKLALQATGRDITERKKTEKALRESEETQRAVINAFDDTVILVDLDGNILAINEAAARRLEKHSNKLIGQCAYDFIPSHLAESRKKRVSEVIHLKKPVHFEDSRSGIIFDNIISPLFNTQGEVEKVVLVARDITDRKRTEEALLESEEKYRLLVEQSLQGVGILQKDRVLYVNPAIADMSGYSREELMRFSSEQLAACMHTEDREALTALLENIIAGEQARSRHEYRLLRKNGTIAWMDILASFIEYQGQPAIQLAFNDLTERKRAEKTLRESEERFRAIFENATDSIFIKDQFLKYTHVNPAMEQLFELPASELLERTDLDLFGEESGEYIQEIDLRVLSGEIVETEDTKPVKGIFRTFHVIKTPIRGGKGGIIGLCGIARDITERKEAEKRLLEREQRFRALFERTNDAVFILDLDMTHLDVNQRAADLLGYTKEELIGLSAIDMVAPQEQPETLKVAAALETRKIVPIYERTFRKKDGSEIIAELNVAYVENVDGNPLHIQSIARDITDRKRAEETLQKSEEKFRTLFEESPISLWEQDFSEVKHFFDRVRSQGVTDFRTYFDIHPEDVIKCAGMAKITDVNKATLDLYKATSKEDLTQSLDIIFGEESYISFKEGLIRLAAGETAYESESMNYTLNREKLFINLRLSVGPGFEKTLEKVFASVIDVTEHKQADSALRESEERFRMIFQESPIGIGLYDGEGNLIAANKASLDMIGVSNITDAGDTNLNNAPTMTTENKMKLRQRKTVRYQTPVDFEDIKRRKLMRTERAGIAYYDYLITPLGEEKEGSVKGFLVHAQDITERQQAEEALQQSEEKYRLIADHSLQGLAILQDGRFILVNSAMAAIYGGTIEEIIALSREETWNIIHPDDRERILNIYQDREKGKLVAPHNEYRIFRKDGQMRWVESFAAITTFQGKNAVQAAYIDITDRKQSEIALKESEQRYRSFIQNFQGIAFQGMLDFKPIFFHGGVEKITGYSESEFLAGMPSWDDIIHPDDLLKLGEMIEKAKSSLEEAIEAEYRIICKDSQIKWVLENIQIISDDFNEPSYIQGVIYDITERKWAEEQLRRQKEELSEFAHAMAHDLRNSLLAIEGYSEMLANEYDKTYTKKIRQLTSQMNSLMRRSVILADAGLVIEKTDEVNLMQLVQEVASDIIPGNISFRQDDLPIIKGDANKLSQVFQNLFENAIVHGKPKSIEISYQELLDRRNILVINDGMPIPKEDFHRIFDRKFTTKKEGGGLGLTIVKKLVEAHGWQIELVDAPKTTFRIIFPNN